MLIAVHSSFVIYPRDYIIRKTFRSKLDTAGVIYTILSMTTRVATESSEPIFGTIACFTFISLDLFKFDLRCATCHVIMSSDTTMTRAAGFVHCVLAR